MVSKHFCGNVVSFQSKRKKVWHWFPPIRWIGLAAETCESKWTTQNPDPPTNRHLEKIGWEQRSLVISSRDLFKNPNWRSPEVATSLWKGRKSPSQKGHRELPPGAFFSGGLMFPRRAALARREAAEQEVSGRGRLGCRVDGLIHGV